METVERISKINYNKHGLTLEIGEIYRTSKNGTYPSILEGMTHEDISRAFVEESIGKEVSTLCTVFTKVWAIVPTSFFE